MLFSCKQLMEQKIYKIIFATLVTFVQILVSEMIFRLVFGSSTFWGTSGAAGADAILFFIELYMGILFLFTNLSILFDNRVLMVFWCLFYAVCLFRHLLVYLCC